MNKDTEKRVNRLLEKMRTAMPEVERQVMVYEKNEKMLVSNKSFLK